MFLKNIVKYNALELARKHPGFKECDIEHLRSWLEKTPHLPQITDYEIFIFLHASYFSVEACKIRIDKFYTMRTHIKTMFDDRDVASDEINFGRDNYAFWMLPKPTPTGNRILFSKILDPYRFNFRMILKLMSFVGEHEIWTNPSAIFNGYEFFVDLKNSRLAHLTQIDFVLNKQMLTYTADAFPFRIVAVHYINAPSHMSKIFNIVKACCSKEITDKFHIYESIDDLPSSFPREILPRDYDGGKEKSVKELNDDHYEYLLKHRDFFLEEKKHRRVNERLRRGKPSYEMNLYGMDGNFKKLDID